MSTSLIAVPPSVAPLTTGSSPPLYRLIFRQCRSRCPPTGSRPPEPSPPRSIPASACASRPTSIPTATGWGARRGWLTCSRRGASTSSITNPDPDAAPVRLPVRRPAGRGPDRRGGQGAAPGRPHRRARHRATSAGSACWARPSATRGVPVACIDHHVGTGVLPDGPRYLDSDAAATGELVFELAVANELAAGPGGGARALRRASSPTPAASASATRAPARCGSRPSCWRPGVDPEEIYLEVYARAPEGRPRLFAEALQTLVVEPEHRAGLGHGAARRDRAARRLLGRSRRRGRVPPLDRGRADGAPLPRGEPGTGEGLAPLGRPGGRGRLRQALRRRRATPRPPGSRSPARWPRCRPRCSPPRATTSAATEPRRWARLTRPAAGPIFPTMVSRNSPSGGTWTRLIASSAPWTPCGPTSRRIAGTSRWWTSTRARACCCCGSVAPVTAARRPR